MADKEREARDARIEQTISEFIRITSDMMKEIFSAMEPE